MARNLDYRRFAFDESRVKSSGASVGMGPYRDLYIAENLLRVLIHSVLTVQIPTGWWPVAVDTPRRNKALNVAAQLPVRRAHKQPGAHGLYYLFLPDLTEIVRANSNLFVHLMPDVLIWLTEIERVRLPRNTVAHMNYPSAAQRRRITELRVDMSRRIRAVSAAGVTIRLP
jgi:hypothetical protein